MRNLIEALKKALKSKSYMDKVKFQKMFYEETFYVVFAIANAWYQEQAEDITQSIFTEIFAKDLEKLAKPIETEGVCRYMAAVTVNRCKKIWKKKKEREETAEKYWYGQSEPIVRSSKDGFLDSDYLLKYVTEKEAMVIALQFNDDLEDCEIKERLGLSSNDAVRQHRHRALKKLRKSYLGP